MHDLFDDYRQIVSLVDAEFDRNAALYSDTMQCGRGCSSCCSQMFRITLLDAASISRSMEAMDPEKREMLRSRARAYMKDRSELLSERARREHDEAEVPTTGLRLMCPALKDGACALYGSRPVVCRKWGIPLFDPDHPDTLQACELNFPPGTAIEDNELEVWETRSLRGVITLTEEQVNKLASHRIEALCTAGCGEDP